uniref:acylphosphatase n=1 Tax=Glossina morsitans morsitans TaxID=37546 RepID=A0A1B0FNX1_GLOMM
MPKILRCDFEVFGTVQGVSFRLYTQKQAKQLGVRGWCMNTPKDTVIGQIEGSEESFAEMKKWLANTGSPTCRIDKAVFGLVEESDNYTYENFAIRE